MGAAFSFLVCSSAKAWYGAKQVSFPTPKPASDFLTGEFLYYFGYQSLYDMYFADIFPQPVAWFLCFFKKL